MRAFVLSHFSHHVRFYCAVLLGVAAFALTGGSELPLRFIAAGDIFFVAYLFMAAFRASQSADVLCQRAQFEDEGMFLVVIIVLAAIGLSCGSVVVVLHQSHGQLTARLMMALASAPLGWFTLHVVAAFHYANLYYGPAGKAADPAPLLFPGCRDPAAWDFLYYSFVVGMTAQVSDVQVADPRMRRATLGHGVVSFFFNTVLIAMAVNAVVTIAS